MAFSISLALEAVQLMDHAAWTLKDFITLHKRRVAGYAIMLYNQLRDMIFNGNILYRSHFGAKLKKKLYSISIFVFIYNNKTKNGSVCKLNFIQWMAPVYLTASLLANNNNIIKSFC